MDDAQRRPATTPPPIVDIRKRAEEIQADMMLERSRGVVVAESRVWMEFGWDVAHAMADLRIPSEAVARVFDVPARRPDESVLTWFRVGFAAERAGRRRAFVWG